MGFDAVGEVTRHAFTGAVWEVLLAWVPPRRPWAGTPSFAVCEELEDYLAELDAGTLSPDRLLATAERLVSALTDEHEARRGNQDDLLVDVRLLIRAVSSVISEDASRRAHAGERVHALLRLLTHAEQDQRRREEAERRQLQAELGQLRALAAVRAGDVPFAPLQRMLRHLASAPGACHAELRLFSRRPLRLLPSLDDGTLRPPCPGTAAWKEERGFDDQVRRVQGAAFFPAIQGREQRLSPWLKRSGARSVLAHTLRVEGQWLGTVLVGFRESRRPGGAQLARFSAQAAEVAVHVPEALCRVDVDERILALQGETQSLERLAAMLVKELRNSEGREPVAEEASRALWGSLVQSTSELDGILRGLLQMLEAPVGESAPPPGQTR